MKLTLTFFTIFAVIIASFVRGEDPPNTDDFDAGDIINYTGDAKPELLVCAEKAESDYATTLPKASQEDLRNFRDSLKSIFDEYVDCKSLPDDTAILACIEDLKAKFADNLNTLVDELTEIGDPHSLEQVTELKVRIENCANI